ncbi:MAG TPA: sec-independent translocase [Motilibacteraceae bacterium]|nr:sec-independent translocase [Motilibacteraceae bacterium]
MFGIQGPEFIFLAVLALVILGPERLPKYAAEAGRLVRQLRSMADTAKSQVVAELGPEFQDIRMSDLDPRTFVSRQLLGDEPAAGARVNGNGTANGSARPGVNGASGSGAGSAVRYGASDRVSPPGFDPSTPPPFDADAT